MARGRKARANAQPSAQSLLQPLLQLQPRHYNFEANARCKLMLARQQILKVLYTVTSYTCALNFGIFLQLEDSRTLQDLVREAQALWQKKLPHVMCANINWTPKYTETDVGITEFTNDDMAGIGGVIKALWFIHACVHALSCLLVHAIQGCDSIQGCDWVGGPKARSQPCFRSSHRSRSAHPWRTLCLPCAQCPSGPTS